MYSEQALRKILKDVRARSLSEAGAFAKLRHLPYEAFDFARVDHHRRFRRGFPEVIYAPGKSVEQITAIARSILKAKEAVIITRLEAPACRKIRRKLPQLAYSPNARIAYTRRHLPSRASLASVAVVSAGTSDIPVAEEAAVTLELLGRRAARFYDCGVAGIHRLIDQIPAIEKCKIALCVAGMEGALPSVLAGLVSIPVIAVPTSVGYGTGIRGTAALLAMLNSCAQGMVVVNIDNGFGAACFASMIA